MIPPGATVVAASDHGKAYVQGKTLVVTVPGARLETTTLDLETMSELLALTEAACDYLATERGAAMKRASDHYGAQPAPTLDLFTWVEVQDEPPSAPIDSDASRLLDLLQAGARGREAAIKADVLVQRLMLSGDNRLRYLVQQLRNDGHLIGSGQDGYYMIDTAAEFERFLEALYLNRAEAIIDTANRLIDRGRSLFGEPAHQVKAVVLLRVDHNDLPMYLRGDTP